MINWSVVKVAKIALPVVVFCAVFGVLGWQAILVGRKSVIRVSDLVASGKAHQRLQVGGRVVSGSIVYTLDSVPVLEFKVSDPPPRQLGPDMVVFNGADDVGGRPVDQSVVLLGDNMQGYKSEDSASVKSPVMPVVYRGVMPPTFQGGRDVLLEGNYDGTKFVATVLMTQCPSKYEVVTSN